MENECQQQLCDAERLKEMALGDIRNTTEMIEALHTILRKVILLVWLVLYGYSGGTQTLDIDTRARRNGEQLEGKHSNKNEHWASC